MTREIDIRLFGAFRQYGSAPTIAVPVADGDTIAAVRAALAERLASPDARALLAASAFATDERVLDDGEVLTSVGELAVLPPVCGG
jgi:molybdopterin converting factor small subunit